MALNVVERPFGVVLLIGGCGFIAHHIIVDLVQNCAVASPDKVHIYDHKIGKDRPHYTLFIPDNNYHEGDICDSARLGQVLNQVQPTVIFDLVSPPMFVYDLAYYMRINVEAREKLLDLARRTRTVKAFVYSSSAGVIHDSYSDLINADETFPVLYMPQQSEPYSHSKAVAETMVLKANGASADGNRPSDNWKMYTVALRLVTPFGANHGETINVIVDNARNGKNRVQIGDGKNLTDWTYIENAARAFLLAAQALLVVHEAQTPVPNDQRVDGEAFLITNGEPTPFWDFSRAIGAAAGYGVDVKSVRIIPRWLGMIMAFGSEWTTWIFSLGKRTSPFTRHGVRYSTISRTHRIDKARQRLKYSPFISLKEGIRRSVPAPLDEGSA